MMQDSLNRIKTQNESIQNTHYMLDNYISYYLTGVCLIVVCCLGLVGNMISLIVLSRRTFGSVNTNIYLKFLAIADSLVLISAILTALKDTKKTEPNQPIWQKWANDAPYIPSIQPYAQAFSVLFQVASVWLTVAFTTDRYVMICHPFLSQRRLTARFAFVVSIGIFLASAAYALPRFFEYKILHLYFNNPSPLNVNLPAVVISNQSLPPSSSVIPTSQLRNPPPTAISLKSQMIKVSLPVLSPFGNTPSYKNVYQLWSWALLVVAFPFILIAVMNTFLIIEVRKSKRSSQYQGSHVRRRIDTDIMLIGVVITFFLCQVPASISHVIWSWGENQILNNSPWLIFNEISNLLLAVNSAINFLPYVLFSHGFRRELLNLFCGHKPTCRHHHSGEQIKRICCGINCIRTKYNLIGQAHSMDTNADEYRLGGGDKTPRPRQKRNLYLSNNNHINHGHNHHKLDLLGGMTLDVAGKRYSEQHQLRPEDEVHGLLSNQGRRRTAFANLTPTSADQVKVNTATSNFLNAEDSILPTSTSSDFKHNSASTIDNIDIVISLPSPTKPDLG